MPGAKPSRKGAAPITVNQEILRAAGLVRRLDRPMKVLGGGELSTALFVVADAFSGSARSKIEGAGGTVSVLEVPTKKRKALGVTDEAPGDEPRAEASAEAPMDSEAPVEAAAKPARARRGTAKAAADDVVADATDDAAPADVAAAETDGPAAAEEAPAKPRAGRKPKAPKPEADA
jgi:hypothetical protein